MRSNHLILSAAVAATLTTSLHAEERDLLAPVLVTATRVEYRDVDAPYASEVHTAEQISASGSNSLYDYLDKHTSLVVMPSYGNPYTQNLDMRGFGIGDGYQNIVVTLNGRRLNNIDQVPQLLSAVPLATINRIEITKGSGSVAYGDGATAGSIQIHTRSLDRIEVNAAAGNYGVRNGDLSAGFVGEMFEFNLNASRYQQDGFSAPDVTGIRDESDKDSYGAQINVYPTDWLELRGGIDSTEIDTRYPGSLTLAEFNANTAQSGINPYTAQELNTDSWNLGATAEVISGLELEWDYSKEDKRSHFSGAWPWTSNYDYKTNRIAVSYKQNVLSLLAGIDKFDGVRINSSDRTYKENLGYFIQGDYRFGPTLVSAGLRKESVDYRYAPNASAALTGEHNLTAWNIGLNHRYSKNLSLFSNLNRSFQAPDIDRFFSGGTFNGFIEPAISRTLNIGANLTLPRDKLKATLFYSKLKNEIYLDKTFGGFFGTNTNIDKSHKYGLELQEVHRFNDKLTGSINYTYTRAIIDREDSGGGGAYDGKDLPGVSDHAVSLGIDYRISGHSRLGLSHTYRGEAYAAEDFSNTATQKQEAYHSTDLTFSYRPMEDVEIIASVKNLFEHENGIWIQDDAIYPVNFTRNWSLGVRASF